MKTRCAWTLLLGLLLTACGTPNKAPEGAGDRELSAQGQPSDLAGGNSPTTQGAAKKGKKEKLDKGEIGQPRLPYPTDPASIQRQRLPVLTDPRKSSGAGKPSGTGMQPQGLSTQALGAARANVVGLRILVVTDGTNADNEILKTARAILDQQAIPYDVLDAITTPLTEASLVAADGSGRYQGVILTTGGLGYEKSPGVWDSALTYEEWTLLWEYERVYKARQLTLYTYPGTYPEDYGLRAAGGESDRNQARLTAAGQQLFPDLKPAVDIPITYAWNYPSTAVAVSGLTTTPLLTDARGAVLAVQSNTSDGRERVALTVAHNPYHMHSQLFSYGLLRWLTQGIHLGEFRRYLQVDVDDWFLEDDLWNVGANNGKGGIEGTYRISSSDALGVRAQQNALRQKYPVANAFSFAVAFNAGGANTSALNNCNPSPTSVDPLTSVSRCMYNTFDWVNHSRDHISMDFATYSTGYQQFQGNQTRADRLGLRYSPSAAVSGEHSGLGWYNKEGLDYNKTDYGLEASNKEFLRAAFDASIRYLGSNRGVDSHWDLTCTSCGVVHPLNQNLFLVPRWPTNIFYYASTPDEVKSSYNAMYGPEGATPYWEKNLDYNEILIKETEVAMNHVLSGSMFPHYMHQTNFRQYTSGRSLVYDWTDSVVGNYSRYSNLALMTLLWKDLGPYLKQRTAFIKSGVSGSWDRAANTLTLTSPRATTAFVTGTRAGTSQAYGSTVISRVALSANTPTTLPIQK